MSYSNRGYLLGAIGAVESLTSAANIAKFLCPEQMDVLQVSFKVTTAPTVTAAVISVYNRTSPGVTSGQVLLTTITIPVATAIGTLVYKPIEASCQEGSTVEFDVTTTATAGAGYGYCKVGFSSENPTNLASSLLSA
jgi:hypothetical protein